MNNPSPVVCFLVTCWAWLLMALSLYAQGEANVALPENVASNVVVIMADDLGWGDVGFHGGKVRTPNLNQLAMDGVELQRFYGYHLCSPARAALLTGQMPKRFGITHALGARESGLPAGLHTLPKSLKESGYQTWLVGKWHLGTASPPLKSGFDHFYGFEGPEVDYFEHTNRRGSVDWQRNGITVDEPGYSTELIAKEAMELLRGRDIGQPFYLQVAFNAPHFPLSAPKRFLDKYASMSPKDAVRAAVVDALDESIGKILDTIDDQALRDNTLVVFLSDNGADSSGSNSPFRSGKNTVFEGGIHLPCIFRLTGMLPAGTVSKQLSSTHDLYPTIAAAVGVELDPNIKLDGVDLWQAISSGKEQDRGAVMIAGVDTAIYDQQWKLIETDSKQYYLFDLLKDPGETTNLYRQNPGIVSKLQSTLAEMTRDLPAGTTRRRPPPPPRPRTR